jgi:hypothetical protein
VLSPLGGPLAAAFNGLATASLQPQEDVVLPPGVFSDANVPSYPPAWRCGALTKQQRDLRLAFNVVGSNI